MRQPRAAYQWVYPLTTITAVMVVFWIYLRRPLTYTLLIAEDHAGENFTALALLLSGVLLAILAVKRGPCLRRVVWALMSLVVLFVGMEEISWGQRLLRFDTPWLLSDLNYQSEMTFHNIVDMMRVLRVVGLGLCVWAMTVWLPGRWQVGLRRAGLPRLGHAAWPWALPAGALLVFPYAMVKADELGELAVGGMVLIFAAETLADRLRVSRCLRVRLPIFLIVAGVCVAGSMVMLRKHSPWMGYRYDTAAYSYARLYSMPEQGIAIYDYMAKSPKLRTETSALRYARLLLESGRGEDARIALGQELERLNSRQGTGIESLEIQQKRITIYRLLGDQAEADAAMRTFMQDVRMFEQDPNRSREDAARATWILAKAAADAGDVETSFQRLQQAYQQSQDSALRRQIWLWSRYELGRSFPE